jgi:hypothetical protein
MSALSSKLTESKFSFRDVTICLDGTLSNRRDQAMADLAFLSRETEEGATPDARLSADPRVAARALVDSIENEMREHSITIRITAVPFGKYNSFIIQNPPRKGNLADQSFGFNSTDFFMFVAKKTGQYLDDEGELHDISDAEWDQIADALTDGDHDRIAGAIIDVNRREGARGVGFLSRDSKPTPDSDATSE